MPDISVIIVNYNVKDLLLSCITSLKKYLSDKYEIEIIIIDNNSSDGSCIAIKNNFPEITVIENKFNAGFSAANNTGINIANARVILLLNPDTEIKNDSVKCLFEFIDTNPPNVIAGPRLLNTDASLQSSRFKFPSVSSIIFEALFFNYLPRFKNQIQKFKTHPVEQVEALSGAALCFKKQLTNNNTLFDENLFWMEDIDFCYRNYLKGGSNYFVNSAEIFHHSGKSSEKNYHIAIANQIISKLKYFKKHSNSFQLWVAIIFSYVHIVLRLILFSMAFFIPKIIKRIRAYIFTLGKLNQYLAGNIKGAITK